MTLARRAVLAVLVPLATACAPVATAPPVAVSSPPVVAPPAPPAPHPSLVRLDATQDAAERLRILAAVGDQAGAAGLVAALDRVAKAPPAQAWGELRAIFGRLGDLGDPRAADGLVRWVEAAPRPVHWKGEVGARLAELGDLRGAAYLAERLRHAPGEVYSRERPWETGEHGPLDRTDLPRVVAVRLLADLALIHPEAREAIRASAEDAVIAWATDAPLPHANAMRFLAAVSSPRGVELLRGWAFPADPVPALGAQPPFPAAFEAAQSALRYLGATRDEPSFARLVAQLGRKEKKLDITQEGLMAGGVALRGMALRALGFGAVQGLAHWGDARARQPLIALIEDATWNEDVRLAACEALASGADDALLGEVRGKVKSFAAHKEAPQQFVAACYAATLAARPTAAAVPALVDLLASGQAAGARLSLARAIGAGGVDAASEGRLVAMLGDASLRTSAAVALLLGGSAAAAARAEAACTALGEPALAELREAYTKVFGAWSVADLESGALFRWVENAEALGHPGGAPHWARRILAAQLEGLRYDSGPGSLTRVPARYRLLQIARTGEPAARRGAVATLALLGLRGALAALAEEPGDTGKLARARLGE